MWLLILTHCPGEWEREVEPGRKCHNTMLHHYNSQAHCQVYTLNECESNFYLIHSQVTAKHKINTLSSGPVQPNKLACFPPATKGWLTYCLQVLPCQMECCHYGRLRMVNSINALTTLARSQTPQNLTWYRLALRGLCMLVCVDALLHAHSSVCPGAVQLNLILESA